MRIFFFTGGRVDRLRAVLVQQLLDTGNQLLVGKWFRKIIVTTDSETLVLDSITDPRCNSYDRNGTGLWDLADQTGGLKTVHLRHHEVHQNKIRQMSSGNINSLLAVHRWNGFIATLKKELQGLVHSRIVIHYEDLLFHLRPVRRELEQKECQTENFPC